MNQIILVQVQDLTQANKPVWGTCTNPILLLLGQVLQTMIGVQRLIGVLLLCRPQAKLLQ